MKSGSLHYNPQIQVLIDTSAEGIIDVSEDIISFEMNRVVNGVSTFSVTLNNKNRKYSLNKGSLNTNPINPNHKALIKTLDRIVVNMTRTVSIQVFSGYVTQAPLITILPNAVEIVASCTIKRLQNTFWDSSIPELRKILPGSFTSIDNEYSYTDGGAAQGVFNLLTKVANWDPTKIHIQTLPENFVNVVKEQYVSGTAGLDDSLAKKFIAAVDATGANTSDPSSSDPSTGSGAGGKISNYDWAQMVLEKAGLPVTTNNKHLIVRWMAMEGHSRDKWWIGGQDLNWDVNNPLNYSPGTDFPDLIVAAQTVANALAGINGFVGYYSNDIYPALQTGETSANDFFAALQRSQWDGGGYQGFNSLPNDDIPVYTAPASSGKKPGSNSGTGPTKKQKKIIDKAIRAALDKIGTPYSWGGNGENGTGFDCSGLVKYAYSKAGISLNTPSHTQAMTGPVIYSDGSGGISATGNEKTLPQTGDLVFYGDGGQDHVVICTDPPIDRNGTQGTQVSAPHTGAFVSQSGFDTSARWTVITRPCQLSVNGDSLNYTSDGTSAQNSSNSSNSSNSNGLDSKFNTIFTLPQYNPVAQMTYGTPRGFVLDEPVLNSVNQLNSAALRHFQSLGNGDFVSWFPDYFGIYSTPTMLDIYEIEITDLTINHNDDYLTTHVAVVGDPMGFGQQGVQVTDWLATQGIISVQNINIMNLLFGGTKNFPVNFDSQAFLHKYGMRPYVSQQPLIRDHTLEFTSALMIFMQMWAQQYSTQVGFTFMPELYPGIRIRFPEIIVEGGMLELYVQSVNHSGSMANGFTTRATVTAPSVGGGKGKPSKMIDLGFTILNPPQEAPNPNKPGITFPIPTPIPLYPNDKGVGPSIIP